MEPRTDTVQEPEGDLAYEPLGVITADARGVVLETIFAGCTIYDPRGVLADVASKFIDAVVEPLYGPTTGARGDTVPSTCIPARGVCGVVAPRGVAEPRGVKQFGVAVRGVTEPCGVAVTDGGDARGLF